MTVMPTTSSSSGSALTILFPPRGHVYEYTLYPFLLSPIRRHITFTQDAEWVRTHDRNDTLLIVGWFKHYPADRTAAWLTPLREKYRTLAYFDDNDGSEILYGETVPFFDRYYKKQVFRDRALYARTFYGNRIFADYYHRACGVEEEDVPPPFPTIAHPEHTDRIRLTWNLAIGGYPLSGLRQKTAHLAWRALGVPGLRLHARPYRRTEPPARPPIAACHARFGAGGYRTSVGYQRRLFLDLVAGDPRFRSGRVPRREYQREIRQVQAVLSPFGWGEVCFRDVEAVMNGAVMVKPDMAHLETWPDLYRPEETYVPVPWDGAGLHETVGALLDDARRMDRLRCAAWEALRAAWDEVPRRAEALVEELVGWGPA